MFQRSGFRRLVSAGVSTLLTSSLLMFPHSYCNSTAALPLRYLLASVGGTYLGFLNLRVPIAVEHGGLMFGRCSRLADP